MDTTTKKVYVSMRSNVSIDETVMCDVSGIYSMTAPSKTTTGDRIRASILRKIAGYRQQDTVKQRERAKNATFQRRCIEIGSSARPLCVLRCFSRFARRRKTQ